MNIYFACSIRSGRENLDTYAKIVDILKQYGTVLTEHFINPNLEKTEMNLDLKYIYERDVNWIEQCDVVCAEITVPSLGVGYEIAYAEKIGKKIICMYNKNVNVSALIRGNKNLKMIPYENIDELSEQLKKILKK